LKGNYSIIIFLRVNPHYGIESGFLNTSAEEIGAINGLMEAGMAGLIYNKYGVK
jgi:hypothetical protein